VVAGVVGIVLVGRRRAGAEKTQDDDCAVHGGAVDARNGSQSAFQSMSPSRLPNDCAVKLRAAQAASGCSPVSFNGRLDGAHLGR
jgi:hypothetical protein